MMLHARPFDAPPVEFARTEQRFDGLSGASGRAVALLRE